MDADSDTHIVKGELFCVLKDTTTETDCDNAKKQGI